MTLLLNPKFENLRDYVAHIDQHFHQEGKLIHKGRNVIKALTVGELTLCVKHYGHLPWRKRMAVKLYKAPKAKKAYVKPLELRERGFESPEPIAYVSYRRSLTKDSTYFVCLLSEYKHSMADVQALGEAERDELICAFAHYVARLHEGGFLHRDFSSDNILYDKIEGRYHFALIDTNSLKTGGHVSVERGCASLAQLDGDAAFFSKLVEAYAHERHADPQRCAAWLAEARSQQCASA